MTLLSQTISAIQPVDDLGLSARILHHLDSLTKPQGSLGRLEELALAYGLARGAAEFRTEKKTMFIFCANHGVAAEGVSAYPAEVTRQMMLNFERGGAAINVLCRQHGIATRIVDVGVAEGTANFRRSPAMTRDQASAALETGIALAREGGDLLGAGEMGIGNTTSAAAIVSALTGRDAAEVTGPGTGIAGAQLAHKVAVIRDSLALHRPDTADPLAVVSAVGGYEIAGMAGLMLGGAAARVPVVVDGFISSAAALVAARLAPAVMPYLFFGHRSAEPGHGIVLEALGAAPLLSLDMRLGEGTGAALAMALVESAVCLYNEMATFESAGVSDRPPVG